MNRYLVSRLDRLPDLKVGDDHAQRPGTLAPVLQGRRTPLTSASITAAMRASAETDMIAVFDAAICCAKPERKQNF
jgi:hypothetical protein